MTSATERLRALLDERGVEWRRTPHYSSESQDNETVFAGDGIEWCANDHLNGRLGLRALRYEVTPEQAVAATLGPGTCEVEESWHGESEMVEYRCTACDEYMAVEVVKPDGAQRPNYCPNCGRKVVA